MKQENQCADANKIANITENEQSNCDNVMNEHLPKVLSFDVEKLWDQQGKIETQFDQIIEVNIAFDLLKWIVAPRVRRIPKPGFLKIKSLFDLFDPFDHLFDALLYTKWIDHTTKRLCRRRSARNSRWISSISLVCSNFVCVWTILLCNQRRSWSLLISASNHG